MFNLNKKSLQEESREYQRNLSDEKKQEMREYTRNKYNKMSNK